MCVKNQQMQQLFIQFINYVWYLLHVSVLHRHPQGRGAWRSVTRDDTPIHAHPQYSIDCSLIVHLSEGTRNAP
jgi:hypothetical protein